MRLFVQLKKIRPTTKWSMGHVYKARLGVLLIFLHLLLAFVSNAFAQDNNDKTADFVRQDLSHIDATPHELAFLQVLSEICPPMLSDQQKPLFAKAHNEQLVYFMPNLNVRAAMLQISTQNEYKKALKWARIWTKSFPVHENKALCVEFASSASVS